jgi:hypothetical protein
VTRRQVAVAAALLLSGCGLFKRDLSPEGAAKLVREHPEFANGAARLALATDIVDSSTGIDAGVLEGMWRYRGRDAKGQPARELTAKGKQHFKDVDGGLLTPAPRELVELTAVAANADNDKQKSAEFTWKYNLPETVQRFTGQDGTPRKGRAEFQYEGGSWKVSSLKLDEKPGVFTWTANLIQDARRILAVEQEASTQRLLALEPQRFGTPDGQKTYEIKISDTDVTVDETELQHMAAPKTARRNITYIDFAGCAATTQDGTAVMRVDGTRGSAVVVGAEKHLSTFQGLCETVKQAYDVWAVRYKEVADRGPLGVNYAR